MKMLITCFVLVMATSFTNLSAQTTEPMPVYNVALISNTPVGTDYEWVWSVSNPNPGNGKEGTGTLQDLSHWGLAISGAVQQSNIVSAAYSFDGIVWYTTGATIAVDPSQSCYTAPVLKFNVGTTGSEIMYYKLVVNQSYNTGFVPAVFKSGKNTGCYVGSVEGMTEEDSGPIIR